MERTICLSISSFQSDDQSNPKARQRQGQSTGGIPQLVDQCVVRTTTTAPSWEAHRATYQLSDAPPDSRQITPFREAPANVRMRTARERFLRMNLPPNVADFLMDSWSTGTRTQYSCYIERWVNYCECHECDIFQPFMREILEFMLTCYDTGLTYNTMNTIRSALSSFIEIDGRPVGQHFLMTKFMKAVFHNRPYIPKTLMLFCVTLRL